MRRKNKDSDNMPTILLINGPNLNLLGTREPEKYGAQSLTNIIDDLGQFLHTQGYQLASYQSNDESNLVNRIHQSRNTDPAYRADAIIINPGAFTHTSIALRDALLSVALPFIEVHISNVHAREAFRRHSYLSDVANGVIVGCSTQGYELAARRLLALLSDTANV